MIQTTYLTTDKLKDYTPISANVDITSLENWIPVVETMHIVPILGTALDASLKIQLEALGTLTGNNLTLLNHIQNCSAWYCFYEASTFLRTKSMNKGVVQQFSDNSQVAPWQDFKAYRQDILDKAMFFRNFLIKYLEDNKSLFPLYRSDINECGDSKDKEYPSGIYLG